MALAETVAILADHVAVAREPLTEWERGLVAVLKRMPEFRDRRELGEWDGLFQDAWNSKPSDLATADGNFQTAHLLGLVFELGRCNLYCAWSTGAATFEYKFLVQQLRMNHGIAVPEDLDVSAY